MITDVRSQEEAQRLLDASASVPVLLLKHSTRCPISFAAAAEFESFHDTHAGQAQSLRFARVLVIEDRPVSLWLAEELGVMHASPQALLIAHGQAVWHASHRAITAAAIASAAANFATVGDGRSAEEGDS